MIPTTALGFLMLFLAALVAGAGWHMGQWLTGRVLK